jgi:hypothetical protein
MVENEQRIRQAARNIRKFFDTADQTCTTWCRSPGGVSCHSGRAKRDPEPSRQKAPLRRRSRLGATRVRDDDTVPLGYGGRSAVDSAAAGS